MIIQISFLGLSELPESVKDSMRKPRLEYNRIAAQLYRQRHPDKIKIRNTNAHKRTLNFLGKLIQLSFIPRVGYCSQCTNNIFDKSCKKTEIHHLFYVPCIPWACTIELCASCHAKTKNHKDHNNKGFRHSEISKKNMSELKKQYWIRKRTNN